MIAWLAPWALAGVALLAGPMLVHMLLRRNARRIIFPTTRFLQPTRAAAVRFRRPSDIGLLILRSATVLAAVLACAQPVLLARWRTARWNQRTARAVVLDTSRSMPSPADASRLADQELGAFASAKFAAANLPDAIARASDWLAHVPPARREIVVISDFQRGALAGDDLSVIPAGVGVRFVRAGSPSAAGATLPIVSGWRGADWQPSIAVRENALDVAWTRVADRGLPGAPRPGADDPRVPRALQPEAIDPRLPRTPRPGADDPRVPRAPRPEADDPRAPRAPRPEADVPRVPRAPRPEAIDPRVPRTPRPEAIDPRLPRTPRPVADPRVPRPGPWLTTRQPAADAEAAARAVAAAFSLGVPSAAEDHRVVVAFRGAPTEPGERPIESPWMLRAAVAIRQSSLLRESGADVAFTDEHGSLVVRTGAPASSAAAPAVVRAVMTGARSLAIADEEAETAVVSDAELASYRREPAPVDDGAGLRPVDGSESRWLWAIALLLIGIETWMRRPPADVRVEERADAA